MSATRKKIDWAKYEKGLRQRGRFTSTLREASRSGFLKTSLSSGTPIPQGGLYKALRCWDDLFRLQSLSLNTAGANEEVRITSKSVATPPDQSELLVAILWRSSGAFLVIDAESEIQLFEQSANSIAAHVNAVSLQCF